MHGARPVSVPRVSALAVGSTMPAEQSPLVPEESIPPAAPVRSATVVDTVPAIEATAAAMDTVAGLLATAMGTSANGDSGLPCQQVQPVDSIRGQQRPGCRRPPNRGRR